MLICSILAVIILSVEAYLLRRATKKYIKFSRIVHESHLRKITQNNEALIQEWDALLGDMRDATPEEENAINTNLKNISSSTGVNFWDYMENEKEDKR